MQTYRVKLILAAFFVTIGPVRSPGQVVHDSSDSSSLWQDAGQKRIDLDVMNMDIEAVLKIISDTSGWTIIPSPKVRGKVSLWSKGATAGQLLDKIAVVNDYVCQREGNIIYLMTTDEYEQSFGRITKAFYLRHQKAESIKPLLESSLTKTGRLAIDPWANVVVVADKAENLQKLESLIARLDQGLVQKRFQLGNAKAADVARMLDRACPAWGPFQPDTRTNSIVACNSESNITRIAELIAQLDQDAVTRVFQIRFQRASELAPQIAVLLGGPTDREKAEKAQQVVVSEATNQIAVTAGASQIEYIADLIEELDSKTITTTIALNHLKATQVVSQISHLAARAENITADAQGNQLIVRDNTRNVERIRKVIQELDESLSTKVFTLEYAVAADIEHVLRPLVTNPDALRTEPRTNQIVLCDSESQVARLEAIIKKLDCEDAYFTRTYELEYASASQVGGIIEAFISRQARQKFYAGAGTGIQPEQPSEADKTGISDSHPSTHRAEPPPRSGAALGSAPGLAGTLPSEPAAATPASAIPPPSPPPPGPLAPAAPVSESLGAAGTVVADDRSNTVTVTETLSVLSKIEQLIKQLDVQVRTYSYTVQYRQLDALELDTKLAVLLRPDHDVFVIDKQTHTINFITIPSIAHNVLEMLDDWDRPARQALIRAKILAVNSSVLRDIGTSLELLFDIGNTDVLLSSSLPSGLGADHVGSLTVRKLTGTQYQAIIRAVERDNNSHVLASPRILALDGEPAEVRMATDEPFTETSIDAENGRVIENVRFLQVGTILQVTPAINEDDTIEMIIGLDVSSLVEIRNGIPVVNHNIANSTVVVENNSILMIGGLKFTRSISVKEKIPLLGDVPIIGNLFRSDRTEKADTELILLLQPTIVAVTHSPPRTAETDDSERPGRSAQNEAGRSNYSGIDGCYNDYSYDEE
jgi:type II secretory pathway component GspD/PulD (secretin)